MAGKHTTSVSRHASLTTPPHPFIREHWLTIIPDEIRRSGRATKGQHTKNIDVAETPPPAKRGAKGKGSKAKPVNEPSPPADDEGDAIIRCICGYVEEDEDDERVMICCDECEAWQHNECMEISENSDELPDQYFCEQCKPEDHKELLAKVARGEKPWEERAKQREREEAEKKGRKRKGKKGKKGRASEVKKDEPKSDGVAAAPVASSPVQLETPKVETGQKRKLEEETASETKDVKQPVSSITSSSRVEFTNTFPGAAKQSAQGLKSHRH